MPSQQEVRWSQLKIGVIVLVSAVILTTLLFLMTSASGLGVFTKKLTVTTYFENAAGLKDGAAVNLQGVTIGNVKSISVSTAPERKLTPVMVVMKIDSKYQASLHKDSIAALSTVGILGDEVVDISSQFATGPPLQDGDELKTKETPSLSDVMKEGQGTIDNLNVILAKLNSVVDNLQSGKGSIGQLLSNPDLYNRFLATTNDLDKVVLKLNNKDNSVGALLNDNGDMYGKLNDTVTNIDSLSKDLQAGKGSVGKLLKDDTAYNNANESLKNLNAILADAQAGKGGLGVALKDPKFAANLSDTLAKMDNLLSDIDAGKGTLGKLAKDDTTSNNINKVLTDTSDLVVAIRKDPKKYLSIKLHIF
jgi:phospholipid/cholesterol/gamma-HCH transport system substrate-binding protein